MEIRLISPEGLEHRHVDELDQLLAGPDLVWVDVPSWDDEAAQVLGKLLSLHPRAMQDCAQRNPLPKVHSAPVAGPTHDGQGVHPLPKRSESSCCR